jgi:outer membrane protein, heavy metal efflux system
VDGVFIAEIAAADNGKTMMERIGFQKIFRQVIVLTLFVCRLSIFADAQSGNGVKDIGITPDSTDSKVSSVSLETLIQEMIVVNPELQAAKKRWEAMQKRPGQASALPDPVVRLGWTGAGAPYPGAGLGSESTANLGIEVSQMFPFPGKRGLKGGMAYQEARSESFVVRGTELNLVSRLKSAYYELQFAYEATDVLSRNKVLLERLAKLAENRYSAGQTSQQDLIKSQLELSLIEARMLEAERNKQSKIAEINTLLNRDVSAILGRPESPVVPTLPSFDSLQKTALESSPLLHAQRAVVDGRQLGLEASRRDYYPDFEVMGGYFNQGSMKDMWEFRVQMNVPIFFARKQRLGVEESIAQLNEAQKNYRVQEQTVRYKIKDQYLAAENSRRLMDLYQKLIIPQASLALESSVTSYSAGSIDFISVFANISSILENEMKYYENRMRFLKAFADLSEVCGMNVGG